MAPEPSERALQTNRKECYKARDEFFKCMQENKEDEKKCRVFFKAFKVGLFGVFERILDHNFYVDSGIS
jgi:hypothetical protein